MKRIAVLTALVLLVTCIAATTALAAGTGHVYGVVFDDANANGAWEPTELGAPDVKVMIESSNGETLIELMSAPTADELATDSSNTCDYLNADIPTPCPGTWGLYPAGDTDSWWKVWITPPAGYSVTTANPQWVKAQGDGSETVVFFGITPGGAGGPTGGEVLLPVTGTPYDLYAVTLLLLAGLGLARNVRAKK